MKTLIFLCNDIFEKNIRDDIKNAKQEITAGNFYYTTWSCGNNTKIEVGDKAYFKRTGSNPHGFFAAGNVVAALKKSQLKNQNEYKNLSEAYLNIFYRNSSMVRNCFMVDVQIESVVDFDLPLEQEKLKYMPQFRGANFIFMQSGCQFEERFCESLDSAWEEHSMVLSRTGNGKRLVDTFCEKGAKHKNNMNYQDAIDAYKQALLIQPRYAKAINALKLCESLLKKQIVKIEGKERVLRPLSKGEWGIKKPYESRWDTEAKPEDVTPEEWDKLNDKLYHKVEVRVPITGYIQNARLRNEIDELKTKKAVNEGDKQAEERLNEIQAKKLTAFIKQGRAKGLPNYDDLIAKGKEEVSNSVPEFCFLCCIFWHQFKSSLRGTE